MREAFKKSISLFLIAALVLSMCSVSSFATETNSSGESEKQTESSLQETDEDVTDDTEYTVTLDDGAGGGTLSFTDSSEKEKTFKKGETVEIKLIPDDGFKVQSMYIADPETYEILSKEETSNDMFSFSMPARDVLVASGFESIDDTNTPETDSEEDSYVYDGENFTQEPVLTEEEASEYMQEYEEYINECLENGEVVDPNGVSVQSVDGISVQSANGIAPYAAATATCNYTYWAIPAGANFGDIWKDGRKLDHVGIISLKQSGTWHVAYCVHHNANLQGGHTYQQVESYLTNSQKKNLTGRALYYGLHEYSKVNNKTWTPEDGTYPATKDMAKYVATQCMVWIIEKGWYTYSNNTFSVNTNGINAAKTICNASKNRGNEGDSNRSWSYFGSIMNSMINYDKIVSFSNRDKTKCGTGTMKYDFSKNQYVWSNTDKNAVLKNCKFEGLPSGASATVSSDGKTLTITSSKPFNSTLITVKKATYNPTSALLVWSDKTNSSYQQVGTYVKPSDTNIVSYFKLQANTEKMDIEKKWMDNNNINSTRPEELTVKLYRGDAAHKLTTLYGTYKLNAGNNWKYSVSNLPKYDSSYTTSNKQIYYTWVEECPDNYASSVVETTITAGYEYKYTFTNVYNLSGIQLIKKSADETLTSGNADYSFEGAVYTVYSDADCTTSVGTLTTDEEGQSEVLELEPGTYYVKETVAPKGYELSDEVFTAVLEPEKTAIVTVTAVDQPMTSTMSLKKVSEDEGKTGSLTDGNSCYSLEGAVYYVYTDKDCETRAKDSNGNEISLTTKADGTTDPVKVGAGTYYVREITPSKGYKLDSCATEDPHEVTVKLGEDAVVTCTEPPLDDPFALRLTKTTEPIYDDEGNIVQKDMPSLEGAIFEIDYYQNIDGNISENPDKKWFFKTDSEGKLLTTNDDYYVDSAVLDDGATVKSDELYRNETGAIIYPLGTYSVREVKSPAYYKIKGSMSIKGTNTSVDDPNKPLVLVIKTVPGDVDAGIYDGANITSGVISATNDIGINVIEESHNGSLKIVKTSADKKPLAGVQFKLVGDDGTEYTGTTASDGTYTFEDLIPQHYTLTELNTSGNHTLLAENIDITLPYELTEKEAKNSKADVSKAEYDASTGTYYFYDLTYTIQNGQAFRMVQTGGDPTMMNIGMTIAFALIGIGAFIIIRRKREI